MRATRQARPPTRLQPTTRSTSSSRRSSRFISRVVDRGNAACALYLARALSIGDAPKFEAVTRQPATRSPTTTCGAARSSCSTTSPVAPALGPAACPLRRAGRWAVRGGGPRARWPQDVDIAASDDRAARSIARAAMPLASARSSTVIRSSSRSARRAAATSPRSGSTAIAIVTAAQGCAGARAFRCGHAGGGRAPRRTRPRACSGRSTLDMSWSDLPTKPVFLPFIHQAVRHLAALYRAAAVAHRRAGAQSRPRSRPAGTAAQRVVLTPSGTPPPARR